MDRHDTITHHVSQAMEGHARRHSAALVVIRARDDISLGSATCFQIGSRFLLATAAHNLDKIEGKKELRVCPPMAHTDSTVPVVASHGRDERDDGSRDVAWIELASDIATGVGLTPLTLDNVLPCHSPDASSLYLVCGLPAKRTAVSEAPSRRTISLVSVGYLTLPTNQRDIEDDVELWLEYEKTAMGNNGEVTLTAPHGMSGGGIWRVQNPPLSELFDPAACPFVGIVRGYRQREKALIGVQVQHWLDLVAEDFPELRQKIESAQLRRP